MVKQRSELDGPADVFVRVLPIEEMGWIYFVVRVTSNRTLEVLDWGCSGEAQPAVDDAKAALVEHLRASETGSFAMFRAPFEIDPVEGGWSVP